MHIHWLGSRLVHNRTRVLWVMCFFESDGKNSFLNRPVKIIASDVGRHNLVTRCSAAVSSTHDPLYVDQ
jgi:hypothetical protein